MGWLLRTTSAPEAHAPLMLGGRWMPAVGSCQAGCSTELAGDPADGCCWLPLLAGASRGQGGLPPPAALSLMAALLPLAASSRLLGPGVLSLLPLAAAQPLPLLPLPGQPRGPPLVPGRAGGSTVAARRCLRRRVLWFSRDARQLRLQQEREAADFSVVHLELCKSGKCRAAQRGAAWRGQVG